MQRCWKVLIVPPAAVWMSTLDASIVNVLLLRSPATRIHRRTLNPATRT